MEAAPPDIFAYRDYRAFLRDYYTFYKSTEYGFSYRRFAARVGFSSPNYLKLVSESARDLTPEMAQRFAKACGLNGRAGEYFCDLVGFNQAATADAREHWYQRLRQYPRYREVFQLDAAQAAYHAEWYIPVVRELVAMPGFEEDPKWVAAQLVPKITTAQARRALETLLELGLIERQQGKLVQASSLLATGEGPLGHHIVKYHRAVLERAQRPSTSCPGSSVNSAR